MPFALLLHVRWAREERHEMEPVALHFLGRLAQHHHHRPPGCGRRIIVEWRGVGRMLSHRQIVIVGTYESAREIYRVGKGVVEHDHATGLQQPVSIKKIYEYVVEPVQTVDKDEVEHAPLADQLRQQKFRVLLVKLDELLDPGLAQYLFAGSVESSGLMWINDYVRARAGAIAQEAFQDVKRGQTPRHADLEYRRCPFGPTYIANKGAAVGRHAHREKPMLGSVLAANRAAGVKLLDESS